MGYHHDHESKADAVDSLLLNDEALRRAESHELLPQEVRRMLRAVALADHLLGLGYRYVFTFAGRLPRP